MTHPKMKYTYVGIDSHKDTHTAVFLDCFYEKLGTVEFDNLPSKFGAFLKQAKKFKLKGTALLFGMEDTMVYGRSLTLFLKSNRQPVKHVNAFLVAAERSRLGTRQKTDAIDATCAARVLLTEFNSLPDANPDDSFWILRTLVIRRANIVHSNTALKNHLHGLITAHYPGYQKIFKYIDSQTALTFFYHYPSPGLLKNTTVKDLTAFIFHASSGKFGIEKAEQILASLEETAVQNQEIRDMAVQSAIRQMNFYINEIQHLEETMAKVLKTFDCTLTSMNGIDVVSASQILSCIGDIKRFKNPAKLAKYAGIAPVTHASGKSDAKFTKLYGNRELNSLFYRLAVRVTMTASHKNVVINPLFYEYYHRKMSEGKTKRQALKCTERRLVNIVWGMLTYGEDYINPPMVCKPEEAAPADALPSLPKKNVGG